MTVRLTAAQAKALGVDTKTKVRVRKTVKGAPYWTVCEGPNGCGTEFHTQAAEDEHVTETKHVRYRLVTTEARYRLVTTEAT